MLNFALCDDNLNVVSKLSKMLDAIFIQNNLSGKICFSTADPYEILEHLVKGNYIDVLLIDIDLKTTINGIDLVNKIRKFNKSMYIIFTTAHLEYGILAYQCKTFDFLPKPIALERLEETILRLYDDVEQLPKKFFKLDSKTILKLDSICYIKKDGMKLIFKTKSQDYETYSTFTKILELLPSNFVRCHKSYIVNIQNITNLQLKNNTFILNNNPKMKCYIGPNYKKKIMEELKSYGNVKLSVDSTINRK